MAALGMANARTHEVEVRLQALKQAEFLLAEAVASSEPERLAATGKEIDGSLAWTRDIGPVDEPYIGMQTVRVVVKWMRRGQQKETRLETYRFASP